MKPTRLFILIVFICLFYTSIFAGQIVDDPNIRIIASEGKGRLLDADGNKVLILAGSPYQTGYQHGKLLKEHVRAVVEITLKVTSMAADSNPLYKADTIEKAFKRLAPFIPARYSEEMKGLADGAQLPLKKVQLANVFPELFHCSGFALFGKASKNGRLLHGRVLDYMTNVGLQNHAVVIVAKPDGFNSFVNVGYAGIIGSVTGMNEKQIAIGEMGGKGQGRWDGMPMTFLIRAALEEADTLDEAVALFQNMPRTCEYYYVISDGKIPDARGLACTPEIFEIIKPNQPHRRLMFPVVDAVLLSAGSRYTHLVQKVKARHGFIDYKAAVDLMSRPVAMKSNLHNVLFAPATLEFWVANAVDTNNENYQACYQNYYHYNLNDLLNRLSTQISSEPADNKTKKQGIEK